MTLIQYILVAALGGVGILGVLSMRSRRAARFAVLLVSLAGIGFVLRPEATSRIAHSFGVGRGADLILYVFLIASAYALLHLHGRTRDQSRQITELTRAMAIADARKPASSPEQ
jgi:hypothetical protein